LNDETMIEIGGSWACYNVSLMLKLYIVTSYHRLAIRGRLMFSSPP